MLPMIQIGPVALPVRPVLMLIAFFLCLSWTEKRLPAFGLSKDLAFNAGYIFAGAAVVAGRLWYVLTHWSAYQSDLSGLLSRNIATISFAEGAIAGLVAAFAYLATKRVSFAACADAATPGLFAFAALASLGALASGDAYGAPSTVPWAITLWDAPRHPSQVYELLLGLATLGLALLLKPGSPGSLFLVATIAYGAGRLFVEAFRGDSLLIADGFRAMQVVWLAATLAAMFALHAIPRGSDIGDETPVRNP